MANMEEENELYLTNLVDVEVLQRLQDAFAALTGMAALTTDASGKPVTVGSNFTDFCMEHMRKSPVGHTRCEQCDRFGAQETMENGEPALYYCHAGLIDYAAPIMANGELVGCFIGGQVLTSEPQESHIKKTALEVGINPDELYEAAKKVHILSRENIRNASQFLYTIANVLSDMAYGRYLALQANRDIEKAANMKSDFLANMSHEIRTPMNAVIGMAEMALREDLPPAARDYVNQIKVSGKALLTIINDILDFSKIESGKMDIIPVEYEVLSIINDVSNILVTRLQDKDVELILDISPDIPHKLFGDNIRIKQVLLNIANNAVKFTSQGKVVIHMHSENIGEDKINLCISVEDTGIGIKEEDLGKLFQSFSQVDSKRNRNIEGTGLGLAISKQLTTLMGGEFFVESEYGKGSTFSFNVPQRVIEGKKCLQVKDAENVIALGLVSSRIINDQLAKDCESLGVEYKEFSLDMEIPDASDGKNVFGFVEKSIYTAELEEYIASNPQVTAVLIMDWNDDTELDYPNVLLVKKPLSTLNLAMIFNRESLHYYEDDNQDIDINFVAPDAEVLIVDDNAVNLTVAEGLLEPLKMKIDTALGGKEAIEKISTKHYDIVFMDHMMPELDGIETTHIIRRFHSEYNNVPIIALTANAVDGVKEMFMKEGMNDFVAKPIEFRSFIAKVKQWLPVEKIKPIKGALNDKKPEADIVVGDLDTKTALSMLGSEKLFWSVLKDYYNAIEKKADSIQKKMEQGDWAGYTIEVHALKSSSKQIGAMELSERAAAMEEAGNASEIAVIRECTGTLLEQYRAYIPVLAPFFAEQETDGAEKPEATREVLLEIFSEMRAAMDELDIDGMEEAFAKLDSYRYDDEGQKLLTRLKGCVDEIDVDACEEVLSAWEGL